MIAISLSPNTETDDVLQAVKVLFAPWRWRDAAAVERVARELSRRLQDHPVTLTSSGRAALYTLLRAAGIGHGDEVIIQAFTCIAVPAAIQWTGAQPVYADIDAATYNLDPGDVARKITDRTRAILVQHTFGIPAPIEEIQKLARQRGVLLIEDCAHGLGATYHGRAVGTLGDAAIFSFGRDKVMSSVFGGAIATSNQELMSKVRSLQQNENDAPLWWIKQQLLHPIVLNIVLPLYGRLRIGQVLLVALQKMRLISKAIEPREKHGEKPTHLSYRFPGALARLLEQQLSKLDDYTARRHGAARAYLQALKSSASVPRPLHETEPSWLRFPLQVENPAALRHAARKRGVLLGDWYETPLAPADASLAAFGYAVGTCPRAEAAAGRIINLPTHPRLSHKHVKKVVQIIHDYT